MVVFLENDLKFIKKEIHALLRPRKDVTDPKVWPPTNNPKTEIEIIGTSN